MNTTVPPSFLRYLHERRRLLMEDLELIDEMILALQPPKKAKRAASRKTDWENEIAKAIQMNGGEATKREIVSTLKVMVKTDVQAIKNEVSAAFVLNPNKRFRKYKTEGRYKYSLVT